MKILKDLLCITLSILILLTGCSNASTKSYDTSILDNARKATSDLGFDDYQNNPFIFEKRYFDVVKTSKDKFSIYVDGINIIVQTTSYNENLEFKPKNVKDISSKYDKICSESKALIYKYIDSSKTLRDKNGIKDYIQRLAVKEAVFNDDDNICAFFSYDDNTVYINSNNSSYICEWIVVHEFVHAISYYTHGCIINNEEYAYNLFNEVMTDIITSSLNPKIDTSIQSGYSCYYSLVYPYINLVGQKAIEAYFYGYNIIYDNINSDEFDFFVIVLENYDTENSDIFYNNLIFKWYATY